MEHTETKAFLHRTLHIDLADFLFRLGHRPIEENRGVFIFSSPFTSKGQLKVDNRLNRFSDPALRIDEGDNIDFGQAYFNCRIPRLLDITANAYLFKNNLSEHPDQLALRKGNYEDDIRILRVNTEIKLSGQRELLHEKMRSGRRLDFSS